MVIETSAARYTDTIFDEVVDTRRLLHAQPELSFEEVQTTLLVKERLDRLGLDREWCPTPTGAVYSLSGGVAGRTVLLRADMDALPIQERSDVAFGSRVEGVMHACGHDGHTAMLLGVAALLAGQVENLVGRYLFLFQPAEEQLRGAAAMISGGVLADQNVDAVLACHLASIMPTGVIGVRSGVAMAQAEVVRVEVTGTGGHGAFASAGNVVLAVSRLAGSLGDVVAGLQFRGVDCIAGAGVVHAGTACNVVPEVARLEGSVRTFSRSQKHLTHRRLKHLVDQVAAEFDVKIDLSIGPTAGCVVNDAAATKTVRASAAQIVGKGNVLSPPPITPSEDFSEFLRIIPGCLFLVGAGRDDGTSGIHHSPTFSIEEESMRIGMQVLAKGALALGCRA